MYDLFVLLKGMRAKLWFCEGFRGVIQVSVVLLKPLNPFHGLSETSESVSRSH
jgi:hypothetical protein